MNKIALSVITILSSCVILTNCSPTQLALTAGSNVGTLALEERNFTDSISDRVLALRVLKDLTALDKVLFLNLSVDVIAGTALLTGVVDNEDIRLKAVKTAYRVPGVERVINEIQLSDIGIIDRAKDKLIQAELESYIAFDQNIRSVNYIINVYDGTVIIFGIAQSNRELKLIKYYARDISNVRNIVDHVNIKQS